MKKISRIKLWSTLSLLIIGGGILFLKFALDYEVLLLACLYIFTVALVFVIFYLTDQYHKEEGTLIEESLEQGFRGLLDASNSGIVVYNDDHEITWMSQMFAKRNLEHMHEKILVWLPELQELLKGNVDHAIVHVNEDTYEVRKKENSFVLYFKDISERVNLENQLEDERPVLGLVNFDNFEEARQHEEDVSYVNSNLKVPVFEYFKNHRIIYKTLRNHRLLLILNEKKFRELLDDRFSIVNVVRKEAKKGDLDITLSMAFARGDVELDELDTMASTLIELAQTRGGDQVVARKVGEEAVFYGGSSEAREKQSKVRVRVMANTIKDLIKKSSNVIIVGHLDADADCVGSALCVSTMTKNLGNEAFIITKSGGMDPMIQDVMNKYKDEFEARHNFVSEPEALNRLNEDSLVIMVDHHSAAQSNGAKVLKNAKRIVVIDHHRRQADLDISPLLLYVEAGASSTTELTVEFLPYLLKRIPVTPMEANVMYLGIIIDTNHFRARTGTRTFDVARLLRMYGADPLKCDEFSQEPYDMVKKRSSIIESAERYRDNIVIAAMDEEDIYPRSIIAQASDQMLQMKEIDAVFTIAKISKEDVAISARSKGEFNVQIIMERMHGGGHKTGAGLQRKDEKVSDLRQELINTLDHYFEKEHMADESNSFE